MTVSDPMVAGVAAEAGTNGGGTSGFRPLREQVTVHVHLRGLGLGEDSVVRVNGAVIAPRDLSHVDAGESPGAVGDVVVTVPTPNARGFTLTAEYA